MGQALPKFSLDEFIAWENAQPDKGPATAA